VSCADVLVRQAPRLDATRAVQRRKRRAISDGHRQRANSGRSQPPSRMRRPIDVIDERLGIKALEYPVPEHANNLAWSLGGVTAAAFLILIATGVLFVQFYNPVPEEANQSVRDMVTDVWGMGFVRALHFWAAQAMYVTAALHAIDAFTRICHRTGPG
jgi:hypothetical protein